MKIFDIAKQSVRDVNRALHDLRPDTNETHWRIVNSSGEHSLAVGADAPIDIDIEGHVGYFCGGMNKLARLSISGNAGQGVGENMMSGSIHVKGDASQSAGATARGGLLVIDGNASARCGISMKGANIIVRATSAICQRSWGRRDALSPSEMLATPSAIPSMKRVFMSRRVASLGATPSRRRCAMNIAPNFTSFDEGRRSRSFGCLRVPPIRLGACALHLQHRQCGSLLMTGHDTRWVHTPPRKSATFDDASLAEIRRAATTGIYDIRGGGGGASCRISTICFSSARPCRVTR